MIPPLNASAFFEAGPHCDAFDALVFQAMSQKKALRFAIDAERIEIACVEPEASAATAVAIEGVASQVLGERMSNAGQILLPLIGRVKETVIPAEKIFAMRSHTRSIADFLARNLFHALSSTQDVEFTTLNSGERGGSVDLLDGFAKRYLWVLREALPDSVFARADVFEKLALDFYFPIVNYENKVLASGMNALRSINARSIDIQRASEEDLRAERRFNACRRDLLELLAG